MISSAAFIINFPIRLFKCPSLTFAIAAAFFTVAIALIISELIVYPVILKFFLPLWFVYHNKLQEVLLFD